MASAARSIALGLALGGICPNTGTYAAGPRLRTPAFIKLVDGRASKACGMRITLASQPAGIWRDCGGAGCEALPRVSRFKDATVGIFGGPTRHIGNTSSWREIFDVDCVDGGRILHVTFDPVEGHSLVCELGPAENISSVQDKVCSGRDGAHFYYTVEHVDIFPPKDTGVDRVNPQLAPRLLQAENNSTTTTLSPSTTSNADETDAPAAQPTSSPTPDAESTPSSEIPTPAPTILAITVDPTAESTAEEATVDPTAESTAEEATVEPTAEPTAEEATVEPTAEPTAEATTVELTAKPTTEATTVEPTPDTITVEPTAESTPEPTSVPETEAPTPASTPETTTTLFAATPRPAAEPAPESTSSPVGRTSAPSKVENTPTPTLLPSPKPSTLEPSRTVVPTSQPTVSPSQPATLEATPTPSGMTTVGEPTASPAVGATPQPSAMPVVPPTPQPTATVAPVSRPTATPVKPVTTPTTSLPPSLGPTTGPSGASTSVMTSSSVESGTQPPVSSPMMSPRRTIMPTTPPVAAPPTSAPVDSMTTEPTGGTESVAPVGTTPAMELTAAPIMPTAPPVAAPPTSAPVDSMTTEPTGRTESIAPVGATPSMELTEGPTPASVPAPVGTGTLMPAAASTVAPSSESFVEEEYTYSSPVTLVPLTSSPSTASPQKEVVSTPVPLPTPPPPPPSPSPAASSAAPTGNGSAAASAASTRDASEGTTSAPASTPTVTPSTEAPVDPPQAKPTMRPTALSTTVGPVAVTTNPVAGTEAPEPTPAPALTTPAPSSVEKCTEECLEIDTGSTWTGNYFDSTCSTNTTQGGCGLNSGELNCRRCVINREKYEVESSASAEADEWPDCLCCVAQDAGVLEESDNADCAAETLETITLSDDEPDLMMMTGAFDGESCEANGIAIIDDIVMSIVRFSDSTGNCSNSFDKLYGTAECDSDTNYNWTYTSNQYSYIYECPDPDTATSARFRRRRLLESDDAVDISSDNVLCNNDDMFYSVSRVADDESVAIVYANSKADGFQDATNDLDLASGGVAYCESASASTTAALEAGIDTLIGEAETDTGSDIGTTILAIIISVVAVVVLLLLCACYCCYRSRKGKEGRADQMRRNLGFTPDMDRKGEGNFGPTNKHVAITRGGGAQMTSEMLATKSFQPGTGQHHRAPSEAPSSIIEDNIANNYRPKKAAQNWEKRKEHKLTKPAPQQHVIGAGPTSEELKVEDNMPATSVRSEQLSEHSLTQHDISSARQSGSHPSVAQTQYSYAFNDVEMDPAEEEEDDDDDARSAATGMSGPSKYAPSGYAPSSHHEGVTHDLMSQYEPSVYEADSQYDPSLYGRESEFGEESSAYSYGPSSRNGAYGQGGNYAARGRQAVPHGQSARGSVADTAAMSHLGSVMEMDDGGETSSAYAPSDSYVSSYVSSEDDEIGRGRPTRGHHHLAESRTPPGGYGSRHNVYRSGREAVNAGRGGYGGGGGSSIEASSRHSGGRSGFEVDSRDFDEEDSDMHHMPAAMDDMEYQDSRITTSSQGAPLTGLDDRNGRRW